MAKRPRTGSAADPREDDGGCSFATVIDAFAGDSRVTQGGRFGSVSLRVDGKVFVMFVKGSLVAKLPAARVAELVASGTAAPYTSGGRQMREWAAVSGNRERWKAIAREGYEFVGG